MNSIIDATDQRIVRMLQADSKITIKEIATQIGMTSTPVYERIRKLEHEGFIKGYTAIVDHEKMGYSLISFCTVTLEKHTAEFIEQFECDIRTFPEVMECYHIAGMFDYLLKIYSKGMDDYQQFITTKLASLDNIGRVQSSFIMTEVKKEVVLP